MVERAFLKSDEAGCYRNSKLIAAVQDIGKREGMKVERYNFSEPQYGKNVCDRILCPMKESIRRFCNEGHNVIRAKDMREALQRRPVKGTISSVNSVSTENKTLKIRKLKGFSSFHNFQHEDEGIRMWKYFLLVVENSFLILRSSCSTRDQPI